MKNIKNIALALPLAIALWAAPAALAAVPGDLDRSFSGDGQLLTEYSEGTLSTVFDATVDASNRLVVVGADSGDIGVARFNPDGSPDATFGGDGTIVIDSGATSGGERAKSVSIDAAGNILVLGEAMIAASGDTSDLVVARVLPNGTLDNTFDGPGTPGNGRFRLDFDDSEFGKDLVSLPGGGLVLAADLSAGPTGKIRVAQLTSTGALDTAGFGSTNGYFDFQWAASTQSFVQGLARQSDGKLVVAGSPNATQTYGVARILANGSGLDTSFNSGGAIPGIVRPTLPSGYIDAQAMDVVLDTNGITVAGAIETSPPTDKNPMLSRVSDSGSVVTGFATNGWAILPLDPDQDEAFTSVSSLDGRLFAGGSAFKNGHFVQLAALYGGTGALDTGFAAPHGYMTSDFGVGSTVVSAPVPASPPTGVAYLAGQASDSTTQIAVSSVCLFMPPACPSPEMPVVQSVSPAGGANDNNPRVGGTVAPGDAPAMSIRIYKDAACAGPVAASGTEASFEGAGIPVSVPDNSTTTFYAKSIGANGNSACSSTSASYTEVTPATPPALKPAATTCKKSKKKAAGAKKKKCKKKKRV